MEFDLQRFDDEQAVSAESQPAQDTQPAEEQSPIPEELGGLDEEYAREAMAEWEEQQAAQEPAPAQPQFTREDYQAKVNEVEQLKAQLAAYQRQQQQPPPSQQQPQPVQQQAPQYQPPQLKITPEISAKLNEAIKAEAMQLSGFSEDDVASLDYADDDDPQLIQWQQAKSIAQNRVLGAVQQMQQIQQAQAQRFLNEHTAAVNTYNEFAQKEFAEPDFKAIQHFATNEFFEQLPPNVQNILANSYLRVERQTASPAEMLVVKNYYEQAKAAYRARGAKGKRTAYQPRQATQMPRVDQLGGAATVSDGELSPRDIEKLLEGDFTKIDPKQQRQLLGMM